MNSKRSNLGAILRQAREKKGLSQEALAKLVGVTQGAISQYELGEVKPSTKILWKLSHALGVSIEVLVKEATHA